MCMKHANICTRILVVIVGIGLMRISSGASGVLVGIYLANLANRGSNVNPALGGTLGSASFGAELIGALPMGLASDALAARALLSGGPLFGPMPTQLFDLMPQPAPFFLSRGMQLLSAAATRP